MHESVTVRVTRDLEAQYLVYVSMYSTREEVVAIENVKIAVYVHGT